MKKQFLMLVALMSCMNLSAYRFPYHRGLEQLSTSEKLFLAAILIEPYIIISGFFYCYVILPHRTDNKESSQPTSTGSYASSGIDKQKTIYSWPAATLYSTENTPTKNSSPANKPDTSNTRLSQQDAYWNNFSERLMYIVE